MLSLRASIVRTMRKLLVIIILLFLLLTIVFISTTSCQVTSARAQPNNVIFVNFLSRENTNRHRTNFYRQLSYSNPFGLGPSIVLRRGDAVNIVLHLRQTYNRATDKIRLEFNYGPSPQLDKGTLILVPVEDPQDLPISNNLNWRAQITSIYNNKLSVRLILPSNIAIGVWRLKATTKLEGTKTMQTYSAPESMYILFNPWNQEDDVYLPREDARQEYVINDIGKIYIGSYQVPQGRKWTYGQYHHAVLPAVMLMLDRTRLDVNGKSDVVKVSRAVSALINSHDDNGLLVGNWSGKYGDGLAPWQWTGSATIFERYLLSGGRPVKFGQCWVFGGVATTALRTLGIPARTISNFVSAHDTDLSLTVDKFYSEAGMQIDGINGDSIWNFHVWSDAWMARKDLPPGYGGWQAIDSTPQETSMGLYQLGPAPLEAIRQGKVRYAYDVGFVYSEVNADLVHWRLDPRTSQWRRSQIMTQHVGRKILTKMIGVLDSRTRLGNGDAEDIVAQYKFAEGSAQERQAYKEAIRIAGLERVYVP